MLTLKPIQDKGATGNVRGLAFSSPGKFFAKASNNHVEIWRLPDYEFLRNIGGRGYVRDLVFSPDGSKLVSSHHSGAFIWNMVTFEQEYELPTDVGKIAYDPQGKWFATIEWWNKNGQDFLLWDPNTGEEIRSFYRQNKFVSCIMFSPDGRILASGGKAGSVTLWDTHTGNLRAELSVQKQDTEISYLAFCPDGSIMAIGASNGQIKIKNIDDDTDGIGFYLHEKRIVDICWLNDRNQLVSTSEDGVICIWNASDGYLYKRIQYRDKISRLAWNHEHQQVAISGSTVKIWAYTLAAPSIGKIAEPATKTQAETSTLQSQNETSSPASSMPEFRQIQADFADLMKSSDPHRRGILLEGLLDRIFKFYQIDSIDSFRRNGGGEQIDGGFRLDGWHYLIECKWRKQLTDAQELDGLLGKVNRSGKQTMGFFLSITGWSGHVANLLKQNPDKSIILMNGDDLCLVIDHQIDLRAVILEKVAQLNLASEPYYSVEKYLQRIKAKDK